MREIDRREGERVCVCERESRKREREGGSVCVCERERGERERERSPS